MNFYIILPMAASLLLLGLGLVIAIQGLRVHKAYYKVAFAAGCVCCFIWLFSFSLMYSTKDENMALLLSKIGISGAIFTAMTFHHFIILLLNRHERFFILFTYLLGVFFTILICLPQSLIKNIYNYSWGYYPQLEPLNLLSILLFIALFARGAWLSYFGYHSKIKEGNAIEANRIRYIFWGFVVGPVAAIDYLPAHGIDVYPVGFLIMTCWVCIISYAILRHHLMDIEVIIKKTLVFAGLFGFVFGIVIAVAIFMQEFVAKYLPHARYLGLAISAVIIVLLQQPVYNFLINITNKYLFQKKYDPRKILKGFSDEALTILNLDKLCKATVETLSRHLSLVNCAILLLTYEDIGYKIYDSVGVEKKDMYLDSNNALIRSFKVNHSPLLYESYDRQLQANDEVKKDMANIKSRLCIPLVIHNELVGILSLGAKKSDQPYSAEDIDMLVTLIKALSIAISNARLFAQAAQYEKLAAIGTLASAVNHEVCNPLNRISVLIQTYIFNRKRKGFKDKGSEDDFGETEKIMQNIITEIRKVANITSRLSSFAKPSRTVLSKPVDISQSIKNALDLLGHKLQQDRIKIEENIPSDLPRIIADEDQMQEVFFNLLKNAAEAIKEKGTITIIAREDAGKVKIEIKDTGCAIPEDKLEKIFDPFVTTKAEGSGYGLSVVKEIISRNKGSILAKNNAEGGAAFCLEFPKA